MKVGLVVLMASISCTKAMQPELDKSQLDAFTLYECAKQLIMRSDTVCKDTLAQLKEQHVYGDLLHVAVNFWRENWVGALRENGYPRDVVDEEGKTALWHYSKNRMRRLFDYESDVDVANPKLFLVRMHTPAQKCKIYPWIKPEPPKNSPSQTWIIPLSDEEPRLGLIGVLCRLQRESPRSLRPDLRSQVTPE